MNADLRCITRLPRSREVLGATHIPRFDLRRLGYADAGVRDKAMAANPHPRFFAFAASARSADWPLLPSTQFRFHCKPNRECAADPEFAMARHLA